MKKCSGCNESKPTSEFNKRYKSPDGLQPRCRKCQSEASSKEYLTRSPERKARLAELREARRLEGRAYVRDYLENHPCVDCGEDDWVVLEFDHVRGVKLYDVGVMVNQGLSLWTVMIEIKKCDVRCANCHRRVTHRRAGTWRSDAILH